LRFAWPNEAHQLTSPAFVDHAGVLILDFMMIRARWRDLSGLQGI
jgi:hypothetical protein